MIIPIDPMWFRNQLEFCFYSGKSLSQIIIIYEKRPVKMDDKNTELYQTLFKEMTPVEYLKISRSTNGKQ